MGLLPCLLAWADGLAHVGQRLVRLVRLFLHGRADPLIAGRRRLCDAGRGPRFLAQHYGLTTGCLCFRNEPIAVGFRCRWACTSAGGVSASHWLSDMSVKWSL